MNVFTLTLRALLVRGRTLGLALLPLVVGLGAVGAALAVPERNIEDVYSAFSANLALSLVVALVSLVIGVNAFDDEREGGTLPLLMATATPRWRIVVAKLLAAWVTAVIVCLPAFLGCAVLAVSTPLEAGPLIWHLALAVILGCAGYTALFVLLSLLSQRGLLIGLAYVVIWEGSLATYTKALRDLSVGAYAKRILADGYGAGSVPFTFSDAGPVAATLGLIAFGVLCAFVASWRLPRMDISH